MAVILLSHGNKPSHSSRFVWHRELCDDYRHKGWLRGKYRTGVMFWHFAVALYTAGNLPPDAARQRLMFLYTFNAIAWPVKKEIPARLSDERRAVKAHRISFCSFTLSG